MHNFLGDHRPFDIFHQINILWQVFFHLYFLLDPLAFLFIYRARAILWNAFVYRPGLLGKNKFEFAKTYCDVKFVQGLEGKIFQVIFGAKIIDNIYSLLWSAVFVLFC